jgi:capsid assembly protease
MANRLHSAGEAHLRSLIEGGHYNASAAWSFSADDGNHLLGAGDDWGRYGNAHLGEDRSEKKTSKGRWKYPAAKGSGGTETVYRSGLIAAKQRAAQQGDSAVESAANSLIELIDTKSGAKEETGKDADADDKAAIVAPAIIVADESVRDYSHLIAYVTGTCWALTAEKIAIIQEVLEMRAAGERFTAAELRARIADGHAQQGARAGAARAGNVAIVPIYGVIAHRASQVAPSTGGTSVEGIRQRLQAALADPNVSSVVLDVDSPGGSVDGIPELAAEILSGRQQKPIVAVANTRMASAAYWLASQASEVVASPSADLGSIGVYGVHEDRSAALAKKGIKTTLISAGKYKTEGHPYAPLSEEAAAAMQSRVNDYYGMFTGAVAKGRRARLDTVRNGFGEGRTVGAPQAVRLGMADRVATLDDTVARLRGGQMPLTVRTDDPAQAAAVPAPLASDRLRLVLNF